MNHFEWMEENTPGQPMKEPETRQNPENRPTPPTDDTPQEPDVSIKDPLMVAETNVPDEDADLESSNESIITDVRQLFGKHNLGKNYNPVDGRKPLHFTELEKQLKETFANPEWLKKQTPVTKPISTKGVVDKINVTKPADSLNEAFSIFNTIENARLEAEKKVYLSLKPGLDIIAKDGKLSDAAYETLKKNIAEAKAIGTHYKGPAKPQSLQQDTAETIEPLSIDVVGELGRQIAGIMAKFAAFGENEETAIAGISKALTMDWFQAYIWDGDDSVNHTESDSSYNKEAWVTLGHNIQGLVTGPHAAILAERQLTDAIVGALSLMERSIKGGKTEVANEAFQISVEGIFDKLLARFKKPQSKEDEKKDIPSMDVDYVEDLKQFVENGPTTLNPVKCNATEAPYMDGISVSTTKWAANIRADLQKYRKLVEKGVAYDKQITAWEAKFKDELESFAGSTDKPQEFAQFLKKFSNAEPKPWAEAMPKSDSFIAYSPQDWFDDDGGFESTVQPYSGRAFEVPAQDAKETSEVKKVLAEIAAFADWVGDFYYDLEYHGDDFSDAPYRGYSRDEDCVDMMNRFKIHAHVSNNPIDMIEQINSRISAMLLNVTKVFLRAEGTSKVPNE